MERNFGGLERGLSKASAGYPELSNQVDKILEFADKFPIPDESLTGFCDLHRKFISVGESPFSNEEWQAIILNSHYPFPVEYKNDKRMQSAVEVSFEIQNTILNSQEYMNAVERVGELPELDLNNAIGTPRGDYIDTVLGKSGGLESLDLDEHMTRIILQGGDRRLEKIIYSIEEAKFLDTIKRDIALPIIEVRREIEGKITAGEKFE